MKIFAKIENHERFDTSEIEYIGPYCTKRFTLRECAKVIRNKYIKRELRDSSTYIVTNTNMGAIKTVCMEEFTITFFNITKINNQHITN